MKTTNLPSVASQLYEKMRTDGYSNPVIGTAQWILGHFHHYCCDRNIKEIDIPVAVRFVDECFGFDYYNTTIPIQTVIRRPLLILFEFEECGNYKKTHQRSSTTEIPEIYQNIYREFLNYVNCMPCRLKTRERKIWTFVKYLDYLEQSGIYQISQMGLLNVHAYINSLSAFAPETVRNIKTNLREACNWLFEKRYISFSGNQAFPEIKKDTRNKLLSYYSKEEIGQLLSCIDTASPSGKCAYAAISLMAHLGMRVGDIINLKFSDIDWEKGMISYIQQKTGNPLQLPLIDEVKFALLDYIKNGRHESADPDYVFVTRYAPYTKYAEASGMHRMVEQCMRVAGIEYEGRHHGPHSLRHSLATNLMADNVPTSAIANILGHSSTGTTEIYLTVDETHLKEISLEVPYET